MSSQLKPSLVSRQLDASDPTPFPDAPRVIYNVNPLELVLCQLRFPPILRISAEAPADFQDALRAGYPLFRERPAVPVGQDMPLELAKLMGSMVPSTRAYVFSSSDDIWEVTLAQDFLALSCKKYMRWEEFKERLQLSVTVLNKIYAPAFYTRIGLRYRDVIRRSLLNLQNAQWRELLQDEFAAEFHSRLSGRIEDVTHKVVIGMQGATKVLIQHGLFRSQDEDCYIIDADFSVSERTETEDAEQFLDYFHRQAGRLFRWSIADRLHDALGPQPIQGAARPPR